MINQIYEKICDLDYGVNKIESLVVFIPGISLIIFKVKTAGFLNVLKDYNEINSDAHGRHMKRTLTGRDWEYKRTVDVWHQLGSLIQTITFVALAIIIKPIFIIAAGLSIYEIYCANKPSKEEKELLSFLLSGHSSPAYL